MKKKLLELSMVLTPLSQAFLIFLLFLVTGLLPAYWIFVNSDTLGYFWLPLQIGHIVLLGAVTFYLNRKKQIREIRMYFPDDEQFFEIFPKERRHVLRAKRRAAHRYELERQKAIRMREKELSRSGL